MPRPWSWPDAGVREWKVIAGSTKDWPFETLNGVQFATDGSKTVNVPPVTTTATGEPCSCQPKLPPGATLIDSSTIAPVFA